MKLTEFVNQSSFMGLRSVYRNGEYHVAITDSFGEEEALYQTGDGVIIDNVMDFANTQEEALRNLAAQMRFQSAHGAHLLVPLGESGKFTKPIPPDLEA